MASDYDTALMDKGTTQNLRDLLTKQTGQFALTFESGKVYYSYTDNNDTGPSALDRLFLSMTKVPKSNDPILFTSSIDDAAPTIDVLKMTSPNLSKNCKSMDYAGLSAVIAEKTKNHTKVWPALKVNLAKIGNLIDTNSYNAPLAINVTPDNQGVNVTAETLSVKHNGVYNVHGVHTVHRLYMAAAYKILRAKSTDPREGVVTLIVDGTSGKIISWGMKNPGYPALHGETSALLAYITRGNAPFPAHVRVYSTLKPCKMCASWILKYAATTGSVKVYYGQDDPTSAAQGTLLDNQSKLLNEVKGNCVRGIVLTDAGTKTPMAQELASKYEKNTDDVKARLGASRDKGSIIEFATSPAAKTIYDKSNTMLDKKITKYKSNPGNQNENVSKVLSYLTKFLNSLNVATTEL